LWGPAALIKWLLLVLTLHAQSDPWTQQRADADISQLLFGKAIVHEAERHLGEPYVWGGKDEAKDGGLDCSGFTSTVFKHFGVSLPVSAMDQYKGGLAIEAPALMPGDLVFFLSSSGMTPMHVGIYLGDGKFIHAPGDRKTIQKELMARNYFRMRYVGARRYEAAPEPKSTLNPSKETSP
jgi:cell wall-associated NlpC family hydrolase